MKTVIEMAQEAGFDPHDMSANFTCNLKDIERFASLVRADERARMAEQPAQPAKLKVTLEDRPIDIELAQYKRMFEAACSALGQIGDALGCDPEEGGAEPILAAIAKLKAEQPTQQEPVAAECKFDREQKWVRCEIAHHNLVQSEPHNWPGYQTRLLYTSPPAQRTWVGLSDLNIDELENEYMKSAQTAHEFLRAIEAKLKEKNT